MNTPKRMKLVPESEHRTLLSIGNEIFGLNSWSHSVIRLDLDFVDCNNGNFSTGAAAIVRVELKNGIHHQDIGYGMCVDNDKGSAIAFARQEAVTNGLREALCSFGGDVLKRINQNYKPMEVQVGNNILQPTENLSPTETVPRSGMDISPSLDDDVKQERKRRQQRKREEFLQQLKQKNLAAENKVSTVSNKENGINMGSMEKKEKESVAAIDIDDEALLSTQEMARVVQSATAQPKPRTPLFTSPPSSMIRMPNTVWGPPRSINMNGTPRNLLFGSKMNPEGSFTKPRP